MCFVIFVGYLVHIFADKVLHRNDTQGISKMDDPVSIVGYMRTEVHNPCNFIGYHVFILAEKVLIG